MIDVRCGNCIDLLDTIPDGSVDLILTDPPYNISIKMIIETVIIQAQL